MKSSCAALVRRLMITALPATLLLGAGTANAQWTRGHGRGEGRQGGQDQGQQGDQGQDQQGDERQDQQGDQGQRQGRGKQLPQSGYGYGGGQQELFEWQGPVDREIQIQVNGNRAYVERVGNNERFQNGVRMLGGIPSQDGIVTIQQFDGRGRVDVVQQPTRGNHFTTIVRLRDPQSGAGMYHIAAYWQPTGNSGVYRNGRRGNRDREGDQDDERGGNDDNGGYGRNGNNRNNGNNNRNNGDH